jgi:molybdate transport system ATP-binding protein
MLSLQVSKRQGDFLVEASFGVEGAKVTALFGPSGAGKTSLVNMAAGLLTPDQGQISLDGAVLFDSRMKINLPPERRRLGYVFQDALLFPHLSVRSNLLYGQRLTPRQQRWVEMSQVVELLGLGRLLDRRPSRLSGGEKHRVAIGRALLTSPRLLLLDEPLASVDQERKSEVLPFIAAVTKEYGLPVLYVSHAPEEIVYLADTVVIMKQGRVAGILGVEEFQALVANDPAQL